MADKPEYFTNPLLTELLKQQAKLIEIQKMLVEALAHPDLFIVPDKEIKQ